MIGYSLKLNKKHLSTNIFIVLQLSAIMILTIVTISSIMSRIVDYLPFKDVFSSKGVYVNISTIKNYDKNIYNVKNIKDVYLHSIVFIDSEDIKGDFNQYAYSKNMAELYVPKMKDGVWINKVHNESNILEIVTTDIENYKVGDIITYSYNKTKYPAKIVGIISDYAQVLGHDTSKENIIDFRDMYKKAKDNTIFFSSEQLKNLGINQLMPEQMFVTYNDHLNDNDILELNREMYKYGDTYSLSDELNINSINYIKSDINLIAPMTLCLIILAIMSEISVIMIQTKQELKTYGIICIYGATKKQCSIISLFISCINIVLSVIITVIFITIGRNLFLSNFIIDIGFWQLFFCLAIMIFYILISLITPFLMIRKVQPRDVLKSE